MLLNGFYGFLKDLIRLINEKSDSIYKNSSLYEKKISKTSDAEFHYKPSPYLLSSIINYQKKKDMN